MDFAANRASTDAENQLFELYLLTSSQMITQIANGIGAHQLEWMHNANTNMSKHPPSDLIYKVKGRVLMYFKGTYVF